MDNLMGSQAKILVVDDSDDTREMMAKLLELEAFAVVTAEDGQGSPLPPPNIPT